MLFEHVPVDSKSKKSLQHGKHSYRLGANIVDDLPSGK